LLEIHGARLLSTTEGLDEGQEEKKEAFGLVWHTTCGTTRCSVLMYGRPFVIQPNPLMQDGQ
jgi:hypothetical protein